jgi:hypothetical protein
VAPAPQVISGLLTIFVRAVETTILQRSPAALTGARPSMAAPSCC